VSVLGAGVPARSSRACLPPAKQPPTGSGWIHEIKHDGFRIMARLDTGSVRLITRNGNDLTAFPSSQWRFAALPARSCLIDGEGIVCDDSGLAVFDLIRRHTPSATAAHCAFDLLELGGEDLRRQPIEDRKRRLATLLRGAHSTIVLNEHYEGDGEIIFKHACKLGCEGIVSKRLFILLRRAPAFAQTLHGSRAEYYKTRYKTAKSGRKIRCDINH
jgi:bifunctional non-homologous end joining protein LigD